MAGTDAYGGYWAGFTATTVMNRNDVGIDIRMPMDGGKINITLEVEAVLDQPKA